MKAQTQWGAKSIETAVVGDLLYQVNVPDQHISENEEGVKVITQAGLQVILRALEGVLVIDQDVV